MLGVVLLGVVVSISGALVADTGESPSGKLAAWARDHHLGRAVDLAETLRYSTPPSRDAATELELTPQESVATSAPVTGRSSSQGSSAQRSSPQDSSSTGQAAPSSQPEPATTTTPAPHLSPVALTPVISPALAGEGAWKVVRVVDGTPAVWTTGLRPSAKFGSVQASFAVIDQTRLRAALFNGTEVPGRRPAGSPGWKRGHLVPTGVSDHLVFAFNGGFRREHARGGYLTEGVEAWKMQSDRATIAVDAVGRVHIGTWGSSLDPAGNDGMPWSSARQNLTLIVRNGDVARDITSIQWGSSDKGALFILRSAVCERSDGMLMYAIVGAADAAILARTLVAAGCRNAMQLDVNASYPRAYSFNGAVPQRLDQRMAGKDDVYLTGSYREFFAFFERSTTELEASLTLDL